MLQFKRDIKKLLERDQPNLFVGKVVSVNSKTKTYDIQLEGGRMAKAKPAMTSLGGYFRGSQDHHILPEGTRVIYLDKIDLGFILGVIPEAGVPTSEHGGCYTSVNSVEESPPDTAGLSWAGGGPSDLLPGDILWTSPEGAFLAILRGGVLRAGTGSLNQVQFNQIDDTLRVVSRNMEVFTDIGESRIVNDENEVNHEVFLSPTYHRGVGSNQVGEDIGIHSEDGEGRRYQLEDRNRVGKWVVRAHSGWLGDVIRLYISQVPDSNSKLSEEQVPGVAEIVIRSDGALRARSCREITFEKVSRIRVPNKIREPQENTEGDTKDKDYAPTPHEPYEWDTDHPEGRSIQTPEYHNHVVDHEEVRRFKDHSKDWSVSSEVDTPRPSKGTSIEDGQTDAEFEETSAIVQMRSDGSIYIEDTHGSSVELSNENISLSARKDIKIQAGRDILMQAGREATLRSVEDITFVSHQENIRIKANSDLMLAAEGNASLDAASGNASVISRKANVLLRAERGNTCIKADLGSLDLISVSDEVRIRAKGNIAAISDEKAVFLHGQTLVQGTSGSRISFLQGTVNPTPEMSAVLRDTAQGRTNTTESEDENNSVGVSTPQSFINLSGGSTQVYGANDVSAYSTTSAKLFTPQGKVTLSSSGYVLSGGSGRIIRGGTEILQKDSRGDDIWQAGGTHVPESGAVVSSETAVSSKADAYSEEMANARFRYRDTPRDDVVVYPKAWQKRNIDNQEDSSLVDLSSKIPTTQDTPDVGASRPVVNGSQEDNLAEDLEQMSPYSKYYDYTYGSFSFEEGVTEGSFSEAKTTKVPTSWDQNSSNKGRLSSIPEEASGNSFKGTLDPDPHYNKG